MRLPYRFYVCIGLIFMFIISECSVCFSTEINVVGIGDTRDAAIQSALKMAVEYASGVYIHSESTVENSQLINDKILSVSKALVSNYSIKSVKKDDSGLTVIELNATVEDTILQNIIHDNKMVTLEDAIKDYNLVENKITQLKKAAELLEVMKKKPIVEKYIVKYLGYNIKKIGLEQQQIELKYNISQNPFFWNDYNRILNQIKMTSAFRSDSIKQLCMGYKCSQSVKIHEDLLKYVVSINATTIEFKLNDVIGQTEPIMLYGNNLAKLGHTDLVLLPSNAFSYPLCYESRVITQRSQLGSWGYSGLGQWGYLINGECDPSKGMSDVFRIPDNGYDDTLSITINNADLIKQLPKLTVSMNDFPPSNKNNVKNSTISTERSSRRIRKDNPVNN